MDNPFYIFQKLICSLAKIKIKRTGKGNNAKTLQILKLKKTNLMAPFYGWGANASRLEPLYFTLRGGSLLFTTKFPEIPGTHFINLGRIKG